jgi:methionyl-tRNA formyltransferase
VHASLLPGGRGAAPIQRAIEAGDPKTGVCLMHMVRELDAGDVYTCKDVPIAPDDDGETLTKKVADAGAALLAEQLDALIAGTLPRTPQPSEGITYAEQLKKEEGRVDWTKPAKRIIDHARAMYPWPGAYTTLDGETLKLFKPAEAEGKGAPGEVLGTVDGLVVGCGDGAVAFLEAQLPNKKRMSISDLVRGRPIQAGTLLS